MDRITNRICKERGNECTREGRYVLPRKQDFEPEDICEKSCKVVDAKQVLEPNVSWTISAVDCMV